MGKVTRFPSGPWIKNEEKDHARRAGLKTWELTHYLLCGLPTLSPYARLVALKLADYRDAKTGACYPSCETLAMELNLSHPSISNAIAELMGMSDLPLRPFDDGDTPSKKRQVRTADPNRPQVIQKLSGTGVPGVNARYIFNWDWHVLKEVLHVNDIHADELRSAWNIPKRKRLSRKINPAK